MQILENANMLLHVLKWRMTWEKYDLDYKEKNIDSVKFMTAREVADSIKNDSVCISSGMAGNARCSIFYWAIRDSFKENKRPKDLTWITVSAQGGRGKSPGTVEELDCPGLLKMYLSGHVESAKKLTKRGEGGLVELHIFPQGEMTFLLEAQAKGEDSIESETGVGTFLDPRTGTGSPVTPGTDKQFITVSENNPDKLVYRLPKIDVAVFSAPYADKEGNIYYKDAAVITENSESALAAKKNGGKVFVSVGKIIEKNEKEISLSKEFVDGVVVNPRNEQTATINQRKKWSMFTKGARVNEAKALKKLNLPNEFMGITPVRGPVENTLSRMAASLFTRVAKKGNLINFGIGLPEEVGRLLFEGGLYPDLICSAETGVYNGLPTPGVFFGGAINPKEMYSSAWIFNHYKTNLDIAVLGLMQADSEGNVNVSKRSDQISDYVGPGGFLNIAASAKTVIFIGSWMAKSEMSINNGSLSIDKPGIVKFVEKVDQVTFSGKKALEQGKNVYYVTNAGIFKLTERGIEIRQVAPGVDIKKDIIDVSKARIVLPESGDVPLISNDIMSGEGFKLEWQ